MSVSKNITPTETLSLQTDHLAQLARAIGSEHPIQPGLYLLPSRTVSIEPINTLTSLVACPVAWLVLPATRKVIRLF